jgi:GAF domain-containing protein/HAMP domain-containing protein
LAALAQQGDLHSELKLSDDESSSAYFKISQQNLAIVNSDPIIGSVYTMRQDEKGNIYFVVFTEKDSLSKQGKASPKLGQFFINPSPMLKQEFATRNTPKVETNLRYDDWGKWISAYAPFYRSNGREGVIGIDVNKDALIAAENNILLTILGLFVLIVSILAIAGWIVGIRIARALMDLTTTILSISTGDFNQRAAVSENNEIGELGEAINQMVVKISASFAEVKNHLLENKSKLQEQTKKLEQVTQQIDKRANQFEVLALVARAILSIQNLDNLLPRITAVINEHLSFYHIGIFLLDDAKEYAVLTAANSIGGQRMLERNHRLKVGEEGIVGYAAGTARHRLALDTDKDLVFLNNPDLPETHSELALPLKIGIDIIGVLDVQSTQLSAFAEEDVEIFSILADYISIAIQNARRFQEIRKTITESDTLYKNYLSQEWKSFANQRRNPGYLYNISGSKPMIKKLESVEIQQAVQSGKPIISQEKTQSHLTVPIKLRGQVIGVLNIQSGSSHSWENDEIDIATAVADRVGLAVENARLLEDSQSRAARERTIGEITSKIGASINIRNVLQTAVEELGHILPGSDVIIQLKDTKDKE